MTLSDDLLPAADPAPLLRSLRRCRRVRLATRAGATLALTVIAGAVMWPSPPSMPPVVQIPAAPGISPAAPPDSVRLSREQLLDSLKNETVALVVWPDGREQLFIRQ